METPQTTDVPAQARVTAESQLGYHVQNPAQSAIAPTTSLSEDAQTKNASPESTVNNLAPLAATANNGIQLNTSAEIKRESKKIRSVSPGSKSRSPSPRRSYRRSRSPRRDRKRSRSRSSSRESSRSRNRDSSSRSRRRGRSRSRSLEKRRHRSRTRSPRNRSRNREERQHRRRRSSSSRSRSPSSSRSCSRSRSLSSSSRSRSPSPRRRSPPRDSSLRRSRSNGSHRDRPELDREKEREKEREKDRGSDTDEDEERFGGKPVPYVLGSSLGETTMLTPPASLNSSLVQPGGDYEPATLYVKNISFRITESDIIAQFNSVGARVKAIRWKTDKVGGNFTGEAFVEFSSQDDAVLAMGKLHGKRLLGRRMKISWARRRKVPTTPTGDREVKDIKVPKWPNCKSIFVAKLEDEITESVLMHVFSPFGTVTSVHRLLDPINKKFKGCAFVHFAQPEEACRAIHEMDGVRLFGRGRFIDINYADRPERTDELPSLTSPQFNSISPTFHMTPPHLVPASPPAHSMQLPPILASTGSLPYPVGLPSVAYRGMPLPSIREQSLGDFPPQRRNSLPSSSTAPVSPMFTTTNDNYPVKPSTPPPETAGHTRGYNTLASSNGSAPVKQESEQTSEQTLISVKEEIDEQDSSKPKSPSNLNSDDSQPKAYMWKKRILWQAAEAEKDKPGGEDSVPTVTTPPPVPTGQVPTEAINSQSVAAIPNESNPKQNEITQPAVTPYVEETSTTRTQSPEKEKVMHRRQAKRIDDSSEEEEDDYEDLMPKENRPISGRRTATRPQTSGDFKDDDDDYSSEEKEHDEYAEEDEPIDKGEGDEDEEERILLRCQKIVEEHDSVPQKTTAVHFLLHTLRHTRRTRPEVPKRFRNPPDYSRTFRQLGLIQDPKHSAHYHCWQLPPQGSVHRAFLDEIRADARANSEKFEDDDPSMTARVLPPNHPSMIAVAAAQAASGIVPPAPKPAKRGRPPSATSKANREKRARTSTTEREPRPRKLTGKSRARGEEDGDYSGDYRPASGRTLFGGESGQPEDPAILRMKRAEKEVLKSDKRLKRASLQNDKQAGDRKRKRDTVGASRGGKNDDLVKKPRTSNTASPVKEKRKGRPRRAPQDPSDIRTLQRQALGLRKNPRKTEENEAKGRPGRKRRRAADEAKASGSDDRKSLSTSNGAAAAKKDDEDLDDFEEEEYYDDHDMEEHDEEEEDDEWKDEELEESIDHGDDPLSESDGSGKDYHSDGDDRPTSSRARRPSTRSRQADDEPDDDFGDEASSDMEDNSGVEKIEAEMDQMMQEIQAKMEALQKKQLKIKRMKQQLTGTSISPISAATNNRRSESSTSTSTPTAGNNNSVRNGNDGDIPAKSVAAPVEANQAAVAEPQPSSHQSAPETASALTPIPETATP